MTPTAPSSPGPPRRSVLSGLATGAALAAGAGVSACAPRQVSPAARAALTSASARLTARLDALAAGDGDPDQALAGIAVAIRMDDGREITAASGSASLAPHPRPMTADTPARVASISKVATALTAVRLARAGLVDLDADAGPLAAVALRHPDRPDTPITLRALLSHTSTLVDPEVYWVRAPGALADHLLAYPDHWADLAPELASTGAPIGAPVIEPWFTYANLNTGIAAQALEGATGARFDRLAQRLVLAPAGLDAGFGWSGVSAAKRRSGATLYRRVDGAWTAQMDTPDILNAATPHVLTAEGLSIEAALAGYAPGRNGTLFSPQGGLRASARDLARLMVELDDTPELSAAPWRANAGRTNGDTARDFFTHMGLGCQIHDADTSPWPNVALIGHPGEAYGLYSGAWRAAQAGASVAFLITGTPEGPPPDSAHPGFASWELEIMNAAWREVSALA